MLGIISRPIAALKQRREERHCHCQYRGVAKQALKPKRLLRKRIFASSAPQISQLTLETVDSRDDSSLFSLPATDHNRSQCTFTPPHHRRPALTDNDFGELLYQSRGWLFDPSSSPSLPRHRDRDFTKAFTQRDFDAFLFRRPSFSTGDLATEAKQQ